MNSRLFIRARTLIATGMFIVLGAPINRAIEYPAIFNPAGSSTVPPSSFQSSPISNPTAIDMNGNLVITGNVRRGMHFRDTVPYGSTTSFRDDLGSSSLSSFLRDSAGPEDLGYWANRYSVQPYYLRSRTVATTRPGYSGVFGQTGTRINNRTPQGRFATGTFVSDLETQTLPGRGTWASDSVLRGTQTQESMPREPRIVKSIRELQLLTQAEANISAQDQQLMVERYRKQTQETEDRIQESEYRSQETGTVFEQEQRYDLSELISQRQAVERARAIVPDFSTGALRPSQADTGTKAPAFQDEFTLQKSTNWLPQTDKATDAERDTDVQGQHDRLNIDIFEQVKQQLEDLRNTVGQKETQQTLRTSKDTITNIGLGSGFLSQYISSLNKSRVAAGPLIGGPDELQGLSQADLSAKAKNIRGPHTNPETFSKTRFNQHFQAAQDHLKGGRYYEAVDSFALASIYKTNDPLCYAGKGHALLGGGEYISSALFLSRAIETAPEYVRANVDLAAMLGGENKLESRITEIKEWLERSGSTKLEFLLGYVYYRMGRLGPAQQAIDAAYTKMPQSAAVVAVKKAVDDTIAGR